MSIYLACGAIVLISGLGGMPHIWSERWWFVIFGVVILSNALTSLAKKGKKS